MLAIRRATPADFGAVGRVIESSYEAHDPSRSLPGRHPSDPGGAPFSWWGDAALSWWVASVGEQVAGFALWRHEHRNAHLHSLFVAADHQRHGVGAALIRFHFAQAARENVGLSSLTLHVHSQAIWARAFYARCGYVERDPRSVPVTEDTGLGDWIRTYARFGWPEDGKLLFARAPTPDDRSAMREP